MTILDRRNDANATQPMDAPVSSSSGSWSIPHRHSGPLDRTGAGQVQQTCGTHRAHQGIPTRVLYPASEAWSRAQQELQPPKHNEKPKRRKFEMWADVPRPVPHGAPLGSGGCDRVTLTGIINARDETCLMLLCGDIIEVTMDAKRGMATLWNAMKARWPGAAEAMWQFEDFPHWYAEKWVAAWDAIQIAARRRTGELG